MTVPQTVPREKGREGWRGRREEEGREEEGRKGGSGEEEREEEGRECGRERGRRKGGRERERGRRTEEKKRTNIIIIHTKDIKCVYQDFWGRFGDGRQDVDTLSREVSLCSRPLTLPKAPPRLHHILPVLILQSNQVSFVETQKC